MSDNDSMTVLAGTTGQVDYFVIPINAVPDAPWTRAQESIIGFETGLDKLVYVNLNGRSIENTIGEFAVGLATPDDPAIANSFVSTRVGSEGSSFLAGSVSLIDAVIVGSDILTYDHNPFGLA
jgi:hypothetical protein